jgi:glucose/arabinose dehydrogenase
MPKTFPIRSLAGCAVLFALAAVSPFAQGQTTPSAPASAPTPAPTRAPQPPAPPEAVSVDAIVRALYAGVSHAPNQEPDWAPLRTIFLPAGRLIPPARSNGEFTFMSAEDFIARVSKGIATRREQGKEMGFSEREISRKTDCYGNMCQIFSTYESRYTASDPKPFARGINAIQLVRDGNRWWVVNVLWDQEGPDKPIPAEYLIGK